MARKKIAKPDAIAKEVTEGLEHYCTALLAKGAPRAIIRRIRQLHDETKVWVGILELLETKSSSELQKLLRVEPGNVAKACDGLRARVEDLPKIRGMFNDLAKAISDEPIGFGGAEQLFELMMRLAAAKPPPPKRFVPPFEEGFRRRKVKPVPFHELAQTLTPYHYNLDPLSAINNMRQGVRRVEREHQRCLKLGIPSPYSDE